MPSAARDRARLCRRRRSQRPPRRRQRLCQTAIASAMVTMVRRKGGNSFCPSPDLLVRTEKGLTCSSRSGAGDSRMAPGAGEKRPAAGGGAGGLWCPPDGGTAGALAVELLGSCERRGSPKGPNRPRMALKYRTAQKQGYRWLFSARSVPPGRITLSSGTRRTRRPD